MTPGTIALCLFFGVCVGILFMCGLAVWYVNYQTGW